MTNDELARYAAQYTQHPAERVQALSISATCSPHGCANKFYNVTYAYLDRRPEVQEVVQLHVFDDHSPVLSFIPTQPEPIPRLVSCADEAWHYVNEVIPGEYLEGFKAVDACQSANQTRRQYSANVVYNFSSRMRNSGQILVHFSGDDGISNTHGETLVILFDDQTPPDIKAAARDRASLTGAHSQLCVHGANRRSICAGNLLRHIVPKLVNDDCDKGNMNFLQVHIQTTELLRCQGVKPCTEVIDRSTQGGSMLASRGYDPGTMLRIHFQVSDAKGNRQKEALAVEFYFMDTNDQCKRRFSVDGMTAESVHRLDPDRCHRF
jgi:hypothetical protein